MPDDKDEFKPDSQANQLNDSLDTTPTNEPAPAPAPAPEAAPQGLDPQPGGTTPTPAPAPAPSFAATPTPASQPGPVPVNGGGTNGLAIAALVVGIVAFLSGWIPFWGLIAGAAAVVLGAIALKRPTGKPMAIIGLIGGGLAALTSIVFTIFFIIGLTTASVATNSLSEAIEEQNQQAQEQLDGKKDWAKGETATFGNFDIKVNSVTRNFTSSSQYNTPDEGKEFILVNITATNGSEETDYFSDFYLTLNEGGVANSSAFVMGVTDEFESGDVSPGASLSGNIPFEVTAGATDLKLQFTQTIIGGENSGQKVTYTLAI